MHVPTPGVAPALAPVGDTGTGENWLRHELAIWGIIHRLLRTVLELTFFLFFIDWYQDFVRSFSLLHARISVNSVNCKFLIKLKTSIFLTEGPNMDFFTFEIERLMIFNFVVAPPMCFCP